jgi:multidrug efflux pump subunit AcrA (membrane-fusion protein)
MHRTSLEKTELTPFASKAKHITTLIILALIAILFLPWEQTTRGEGRLIAYEPTERDYQLLAPISGFVKTYHIEEDSFVKKGDLLFEMVDLDAEYLDKLKAIGNDIDAQYDNMHSTLEKAQEQKLNIIANLQTSKQIYDRKIAQIEDAIRALRLQELQEQNNYKVATANYERMKLLFEEGIESKRTYEVAENAYLKAATALETIEVTIQREQKSLAIQQREKERFIKEQDNAIKTIENTILGYQSTLKSLEQNKKQASINVSRNTTAKVYATKDGYPLRILKNDQDAYIKQGEPLVHFSPKITKRTVLLKIRRVDMPLIKKGLKVRVQFYGWPAMQVSGWPKITYGTFGGIIDKIDPIAHEEGVFYAYVTEDPQEPWPADDVLKVGTRANGWVRLSTVTIAYEIWRMHNALPSNMVITTEAP